MRFTVVTIFEFTVLQALFGLSY